MMILVVTAKQKMS